MEERVHLEHHVYLHSDERQLERLLSGQHRIERLLLRLLGGHQQVSHMTIDLGEPVDKSQPRRSPQGVRIMADVTTDQHFPSVALTITDAKNRPAKVDGVPIWASSDETVITVVAATDGMSADIETVAPGTARVTVTADADLGAGVTTITGVTEDINVTPGTSTAAALMALNLGAAVDKP